MRADPEPTEELRIKALREQIKECARERRLLLRHQGDYEIQDGSAFDIELKGIVRKIKNAERELKKLGEGTS